MSTIRRASRPCTPRPTRATTRCCRAFKQRTGCPVLVNTSFNVRGEPIVCTPEDAFRCFMGTEMETLVIGNAPAQGRAGPALAEQYARQFEED